MPTYGSSVAAGVGPCWDAGMTTTARTAGSGVQSPLSAPSAPKAGQVAVESAYVKGDGVPSLGSTPCTASFYPARNPSDQDLRWRRWRHAAMVWMWLASIGRLHTPAPQSLGAQRLDGYSMT